METVQEETRKKCIVIILHNMAKLFTLGDVTALAHITKSSPLAVHGNKAITKCITDNFDDIVRDPEFIEVKNDQYLIELLQPPQIAIESMKDDLARKHVRSIFTYEKGYHMGKGDKPTWYPDSVCWHTKKLNVNNATKLAGHTRMVKK